jgi:hypothetical protein
MILTDSLSVYDSIWIDDTTGSLFTNSIKDATTQNGGGTLTIDVGTVNILGNLDVSGTYNTGDITSTTLLVEDKNIVLSTNSNYDAGSNIDTTVDGSTTNDQSGMKVAGKPNTTELSSTTLNTGLVNSNIWNKQLYYNYNSGMSRMGYLEGVDDDTARDNESFWELKPGALRLSADRIVNNQVETTSFGFRINNNLEMEIYKKTGNSSGKKVARFGISSIF